MTAAPNNSTKKILALGGEFNGGKVTGIVKTGVMTIKGTYTRFYPKETVEAELKKKELVS
jgi:hypothetical protein